MPLSAIQARQTAAPSCRRGDAGRRRRSAASAAGRASRPPPAGLAERREDDVAGLVEQDHRSGGARPACRSCGSAPRRCPRPPIAGRSPPGRTRRSAARRPAPRAGVPRQDTASSDSSVSGDRHRAEDAIGDDAAGRREAVVLRTGGASAHRGRSSLPPRNGVHCGLSCTPGEHRELLAPETDSIGPRRRRGNDALLCRHAAAGRLGRAGEIVAGHGGGAAEHLRYAARRHRLHLRPGLQGGRRVAEDHLALGDAQHRLRHRHDARRDRAEPGRAAGRRRLSARPASSATSSS